MLDAGLTGADVMWLRIAEGSGDILARHCSMFHETRGSDE
jgi:hypothetical protein